MRRDVSMRKIQGRRRRNEMIIVHGIHCCVITNSPKQESLKIAKPFSPDDLEDREKRDSSSVGLRFGQLDNETE